MRIGQVLEAFPNEATRIPRGERERVDGLTRAAAIVRFATGAHSYAVDFLFDHGRLAAIRLRLMGGGDDAAPAYEEMVSWLSSAHGPPPEQREQPPTSGSWERRVTWTTPESLIDLHAWRTDLRESHVLALDMRAGDIRPENEGSVVVTYRPAAAPRS
jgi:hypothetical protein